MPTITYFSENFNNTKYSHFSGQRDLIFTWSELTRAAITVGKKEYSEIFRFQQYSCFELMFRVFIVYANLKQGARRKLYRTEVYRNLDPSEKGAVSYFLALTLAKLFAEKCLQVPWLMHLDVYSSELGVTLGKTRQRPDLIGQASTQNWIVMEAKGRSGQKDPPALARAKGQAGVPNCIDGKSPELRVAFMSYFRKDALEVVWEDPAETDHDHFNLEYDPNAWWRAYYRTIRTFLSEDQSTDEVLKPGGPQYPGQSHLNGRCLT